MRKIPPARIVNRHLRLRDDPTRAALPCPHCSTLMAPVTLLWGRKPEQGDECTHCPQIYARQNFLERWAAVVIPVPVVTLAVFGAVASTGWLVLMTRAVLHGGEPRSAMGPPAVAAVAMVLLAGHLLFGLRAMVRAALHDGLTRVEDLMSFDDD